MLFIIFQSLGEYDFSCKVRAIGFDANKRAEMSREMSTGTVVIVFFRLSKAAYCTGFQVHILLLLIISKRSQAISEKP